MPTVSVLSVMDAVPPVAVAIMEALPTEVVPSKKVTVPVIAGVAAPTMVAVRVSDWPTDRVAAETPREVVVGMMVTVTVCAAVALVASLESPL